MIKCAKIGAKGRDLSTAFAIFEKWDFKFTVDSSAANLFNSWEI
jgi:acyl-homoserine lactone acylase PvdQ